MTNRKSNLIIKIFILLQNLYY